MSNSLSKLQEAIAFAERSCGIDQTKTAAFIPIQGPQQQQPMPPQGAPVDPAMQGQPAPQGAPVDPAAMQGAVPPQPDPMAELQQVLGNMAQMIQQMGSAMESLKRELDGVNKDLDAMRKQFVVLNARQDVLEKAVEQTAQEPPMMDPSMMMMGRV